MVINCYLATVSYTGITVKALEENLKEMCLLPGKHIPEENYFFDFDAFYQVQMHGGQTIFDGIYDIQDKQFINQVFWVEQEKLHSYDTHDINGGNYNCFWGYYFSPCKDYEFSKAADYFNYRIEAIRECMNHETFWSLKGYVFPSLVFADSVERNISEIKDDGFTIIKEGLEKLERASSLWNGNPEVDIIVELGKFGKRYSGESETTRKNDKLMKMRDFDFGERGVVRCEKHLKLSEYLRIHLYSDYNTRNICIGYAGPHLPTASEKH